MQSLKKRRKRTSSFCFFSRLQLRWCYGNRIYSRIPALILKIASPTASISLSLFFQWFNLPTESFFFARLFPLESVVAKPTSASLQDHASKRDGEVLQLKNSNIGIIKVRQQCNSIDKAMKWPRMWEEAVRQRAFLDATRVAYARRELADFTLKGREGCQSIRTIVNKCAPRKNRIHNTNVYIFHKTLSRNNLTFFWYFMTFVLCTKLYYVQYCSFISLFKHFPSSFLQGGENFSIRQTFIRNRPDALNLDAL